MEVRREAQDLIPDTVTDASSAFDRAQFHEAYPPGIERSYWHVARNRIIGRTLLRHVPPGAHVLEVGCGPGIVTEHLRESGYEAIGTDLGLPQDLAGDRPYLLLGRDALTLDEELRKRFTALALFDVIEHIEDPRSFLKALLIAYPNVRTVIVTVPARKEIWTNFDDHFGHYRRYTRAMLRTEMEGCGLRPLHTRYFFHVLYAGIRLNNMLRGNTRNIRFVPPAAGASTALHGLLGRLFALGPRLLPGVLPGSSLVCVAQRT